MELDESEIITIDSCDTRNDCSTETTNKISNLKKREEGEKEDERRKRKRKLNLLLKGILL